MRQCAQTSVSKVNINSLKRYITRCILDFSFVMYEIEITKKYKKFTRVNFHTIVSNYLRDRIFMVVDSRSVFQTQRTIPKMALINVTINDNRITLSTPTTDPVTFIAPKDTTELRRSCR